MSGLTIGKIARQAGVGIDTVRYYERSGLLPPPPRRDSGYRDYPPETAQRLRFIRRAKDLGFTLEEIGGMRGVSLAHARYWESFGLSLVTGYLAAWPVNKWMLGRNMKKCH